MEIRQLRYFANAAKTLSFTEAARLSNITQSTLSQQIKQLENELGVLLFHRIGKHIQLTNEGGIFLEDALRLLDTERQSLQRLADVVNLQSGTINVGIAAGLGLLAMLADTITEYNKLYSKIDIRLHQAAAPLLTQMLRRHEVDIALSFNSAQTEEDLTEKPLFATRLCAIMGEHHPLAGKERVSLEQLRHQPLVLPSRNLLVRNFLDRIARKRGVQLQPAVEVNDLSHIIFMVRSGRWVSVLPDAATLSVRGLVRKNFEENFFLPTSVLSLAGVYQRKAVTEFLRLLAKSARYMLQTKEEACEICGETFLV